MKIYDSHSDILDNLYTRIEEGVIDVVGVIFALVVYLCAANVGAVVARSGNNINR